MCVKYEVHTLHSNKHSYQHDQRIIAGAHEHTCYLLQPPSDLWNWTCDLSFVNWVSISSCNGLVPSHFLNQHWLIVKWTVRNKPKWNLNQNTKNSNSRNCHRQNGAHFVQGKWVNIKTHLGSSSSVVKHPPLTPGVTVDITRLFLRALAMVSLWPNNKMGWPYRWVSARKT